MHNTLHSIIRAPLIAGVYVFSPVQALHAILIIQNSNHPLKLPNDLILQGITNLFPIHVLPHPNSYLTCPPSPFAFPFPFPSPTGNSTIPPSLPSISTGILCPPPTSTAPPLGTS